VTDALVLVAAVLVLSSLVSQGARLQVWRRRARQASALEGLLWDPPCRFSLDMDRNPETAGDYRWRVTAVHQGTEFTVSGATPFDALLAMQMGIARIDAVRFLP